MKKFSQAVLILILILVLALSGCGGGSGGGNNDGPGGGGGYTGVVFTMVDGPLQSYEIAQTEVTYELWYAVYTWAIDNGYNFANAGWKGSSNLGSDQQPVTTINWRDAMVWCNALTEYYAAKGGSNYKCVYYSDSAYTTPIRISTGDSISYPIPAGSQDAPYVKPDAKGFRLPTSDEWYQAARYIDGTKTYPDHYASGADAAYDVTDKTGIIDYDGDGDVHLSSDVAIYDVSSTAAVKSKSPNKLGLYDMSGNVWELCFDWETEGSLRVTRGGGYSYSANYLQLSYIDRIFPDGGDYTLGFRPVRTK